MESHHTQRQRELSGENNNVDISPQNLTWPIHITYLYNIYSTYKIVTKKSLILRNYHSPKFQVLRALDQKKKQT